MEVQGPPGSSMGPDMPSAAAAALEAASATSLTRKGGQPAVKSSNIQLATSSGDDDDDENGGGGGGRWATTVDAPPTQRPGPALVPAPAIPRVTQAEAAAIHKINSAWTAHIDSGSGAIYYHNTVTSSSVWTRPQGVVIAPPDADSSDDDDVSTLLPEPAMLVKILTGHPDWAAPTKWHSLIYSGAKDGYNCFEAPPSVLMRDPTLVKKIMTSYNLKYVAAIGNPRPKPKISSPRSPLQNSTRDRPAADVHSADPDGGGAGGADKEGASAKDYLQYVQHFATQARSAIQLGATMAVVTLGHDWWPVETCAECLGAVEFLAAELGLATAHRTGRGGPMYAPYRAQQLMRLLPNLRVDCDTSEWGLAQGRLFDPSTLPDESYTDLAEMLRLRSNTLSISFNHTAQFRHPADPALDPDRRVLDVWWHKVVAAMFARENGAAYVRVNHRGARAKLPFSKIELFDEANANGWMVDHFHDLFYNEYPGIARPLYTAPKKTKIKVTKDKNPDAEVSTKRKAQEAAPDEKPSKEPKRNRALDQLLAKCRTEGLTRTFGGDLPLDSLPDAGEVIIDDAGTPAESRRLYGALDNETPIMIAKKFELSITQVMVDNVENCAGLSRKAKLMPATLIILPPVASGASGTDKAEGMAPGALERDDNAIAAVVDLDTDMNHQSAAAVAGESDLAKALQK